MRLYHTSSTRLTPPDVKLDNVFVNLQKGDSRFSEVQLGDLGGCYPADSEWATSGTLTGTPIWSAPEMLMEMRWTAAADIWAFGILVGIFSAPNRVHTGLLKNQTQLTSLPYGGDFNLSRSAIKRDHEEYIVHVMMEQYKFSVHSSARLQNRQPRDRAIDFMADAGDA